MNTANTAERLAAVLKELRLPTVRTRYRQGVDRAVAENLGYEQFLLELLEQEAEARFRHRIERLLRQSRLPAGKTLANFDLQRLPGSLPAQIATLAEGGFIDRCENVLAFGNPAICGWTSCSKSWGDSRRLSSTTWATCSTAAARWRCFLPCWPSDTSEAA